MANDPARRAKRFYSDTVYYEWRNRAEVVGLLTSFQNRWETAAQSDNPRQEIGAIQDNIRALEAEIVARH
jgi:hypothetical protein